MTSPAAPGPASPASGPGQGMDSFYLKLRELGIVRPTVGRRAGGVCAGVGAKLGLAPGAVRLGFVLLMIFGGVSLVVYLIALALLPNEDGKILLEEALRRGDGGGIVLLIVIANVLISQISDNQWLWLGVPLALATWWGVSYAVTGRHPTLPRFARPSGPTGADPTTPGNAPTYAAPAPVAAPTLTRPAPWPAPSGSSPLPGPGSGSSTVPVPTVLTRPIPIGTAGPRPQDAPGWPAAADPVRAMGPGRTYVPAKVAVAVPPKRARAGFAFWLVAIGVGIASVAMTQANVAPQTSQKSVALGLAIGSGLMGLLLLVAGVRGRRAGGTALVTTMALIGSAFLAFGPTNMPWSGGVGQRIWQPSASADQEYSLAAGDGELNLSRITPGEGPIEIRATVGLGQLTIVVPAGLRVRVDASLGAGEVSYVDAAGSHTLLAGSGKPDPVAVGDPAADPHVIVQASVGLGELEVRGPDAPARGGKSKSPATTSVGVPVQSTPASTVGSPGGAR